jgi:hypothetical protein
MDTRLKIERTLRKSGVITFTEAEVKLLSAEVRRVVGAGWTAALDHSGISIEDNIRWSLLGTRCRQAREALGVSIKEVAKGLKVPQYRLQAIETGTLRDVEPEIADRYFARLGITRWVARWARTK